MLRPLAALLLRAALALARDCGDAAWANALTARQLGELVRSGDLACAAKAAAVLEKKGAATLASEVALARRGVDTAP